MKKLIALDLDGTLFNDEKIITPKTKAALMSAQEAGAIVVLASGRPASGLLKEAEILNLKENKGLLVSYNGGKVVSAETGETWYENSIPNELAKRLLAHVKNYPVAPIVDDGQAIYTDNVDGFQVQYEANANNLKVKEFDNIVHAVDFNPVKVLIAAKEEVLQPIMDDICRPFEEELSFILSTPFYLEATSKGISKASALEEICRRLNITKEDVIAFGDAENDMSMISFAGIGVAMENASPALKEIADEITRNNNEDGIAYTLSKYFDGIHW